jgi:hypothetical protein
MEGDEGEAAVADAGGDAFGVGVGEGGVADMAPPDDDIGGVESGFVDALFWGDEVGGFDFQTWEGAEVSGDGFAEEEIPVGFFLFGLLFVPNEHADGGRSGVEGGGGGEEEEEDGGEESGEAEHREMDSGGWIEVERRIVKSLMMLRGKRERGR